MKIFEKINSAYAILRANWHLRKATKLGRHVQFRGKIFIRNEGSLIIGDQICFHAGPVATDLTTHRGGCINIGASTMINYGCILNANKLIQIGSRCRLGYYVVILDSHMHHLNVELRHMRPTPKEVIIEDDVWIGTRATILTGVRIGRGSVVASGSIVTTDVPPYSVVAGVPAKVIKKIPNLEKSQHPSRANLRLLPIKYLDEMG